MRNKFENKYVRKIILAEVASEGKTTQNQVLRSLCVYIILTGQKQHVSRLHRKYFLFVYFLMQTWELKYTGTMYQPHHPLMKHDPSLIYP